MLFRSLVICDLWVYAQALNGDVFHYRDKNGLEVDAIVHMHDGGWVAFEVALAHSNVGVGAKSLRKLRGKVDTEKMGSPSFLAVITATGYAYMREDETHVIPIGTLDP